MHRSVIVAALLLVAPVPLAAQAHYAPPGDTLRYRQEIKTSGVVSTPQGEFPITADMSGIAAIVRTPGDSARAWFESLTISASNPGGEQTPSTAELVGKPYRLTFDSRGRVTLVEAPAIPQSLEGMGDLTNAFGDFFLRLPDKPLRVGLAWTDTTTRGDSTGERSMRATSVADYRVERDTVVNGTKALVVGVKQKVRIEASGPVPNAPAPAQTKLDGTDEGYVVFAPSVGRMLSRTHEGHFSGETTIAAPANMTIKQAIDIRGTTEQVR
jgi:hypothetical protein